MLTRTDCRKGMEVRFGRPTGQQTLAKIIKVNPVKVKVKTLESRGTGGGSAPGVVWNVPYSMLYPVDDLPKGGKKKARPATLAALREIRSKLDVLINSLAD